MIAAALRMAPARFERKSIGLTDAVLAIFAVTLAWASAHRFFGPGRDYLEYARFYTQLGANFDPFAGRFEPGFELIAWVMGQALELGFETFMMTMALIALSVKFYLFRRYLAYPLLAAVIYTLIFYPIHEYTQIRAALGIGFGFLAIHRMLERKWISAAAFLVLGILFHYSVTILGLAAVASLFMQGARARMILLTVSAVLIALSGPISTYILPYFSTFNPLLAGYFYNQMFDEAVNLFAVSNLLMMLTIVAMAVVGMTDAGKYRQVFLTLSILAFAGLGFFASSPVLAHRVKELLFVALVFLVFHRPVRSLPEAVPVFLITLCGLWMIVRYFQEGVLGF